MIKRTLTQPPSDILSLLVEVREEHPELFSEEVKDWFAKESQYSYELEVFLNIRTAYAHFPPTTKQPVHPHVKNAWDSLCCVAAEILGAKDCRWAVLDNIQPWVE